MFDLLIANVDKPVELYVYNSETDEVRQTVLMPTKDWGGEGLLGACIGHGFLHALPQKCCVTIGKYAFIAYFTYASLIFLSCD